MENKEMNALFEALGEANQFLCPVFASKEAMRAYYLQMNEFMNYGTPPSDHPQQADFRRLQKKLKQYINTLQLLNTHEWGDEIVDIETASNGYMMLKNTDFYRKMEVSRTVSKHLLFLVRVSQNLYLLRQIQSMLHVHYQNVTLLMEEA